MNYITTMMNNSIKKNELHDPQSCKVKHSKMSWFEANAPLKLSLFPDVIEWCSEFQTDCKPWLAILLS